MVRFVCAVEPEQMKRVKADDLDSVVSITGLRASQRYLVTVESRSVSDVNSAERSSVCVTTLSDSTMTVLCAVLLTLAAVLALLLVTAAAFYIWRYLYFFMYHFTYVGPVEQSVRCVCVSVCVFPFLEQTVSES